MRFGSYEWTPTDVDAVETYADVVAALLQFTGGVQGSRRVEGIVES